MLLSLGLLIRTSVMMRHGLKQKSLGKNEQSEDYSNGNGPATASKSEVTEMVQ